MPSALDPTFLSVAMIAGFLLAAGGLWTMIRGHKRGKGALMLTAAIVLLANVLIWTL